jgi:hypothetical protein
VFRCTPHASALDLKHRLLIAAYSREIQMTDAGKTIMRSMLAGAVALSLSAFVPSASRAQGVASGLVNISTPSIVAPQQLGFRADARIFGGDEDTTYFGAEIRYGLAANWELEVGTSIAQFESYNIPGGGVIRHGGSDLEISTKYSVKQSNKSAISAEFGVGLPNTPAQQSAHLTVGLAGSLNVGSGVDVYLNPRAVLITANSIYGLGMGAKAKLSRQLSLIADYTPILAGANTIDTTTGAMRSHDVYGAALRYLTNNGTIAVDLGWTNGTGFTTGSSLTPGLGNSSAFYVSLNFKR